MAAAQFAHSSGPRFVALPLHSVSVSIVTETKWRNVNKARKKTRKYHGEQQVRQMFCVSSRVNIYSEFLSIVYNSCCAVQLTGKNAADSIWPSGSSLKCAQTDGGKRHAHTHTLTRRSTKTSYATAHKPKSKQNCIRPDKETCHRPVLRLLQVTKIELRFHQEWGALEREGKGGVVVTSQIYTAYIIQTMENTKTFSNNHGGSLSY